MRTFRPVHAIGVLAAVTSLLAASCSSSGSSTGTSASSTVASTGGSQSSVVESSAQTSAPVSTVAAPKGDPIVLAMISQESGPAALPDSRLAAEAAVAYVNAELGGAGGRPFKLESCVTDGSPEQSSACANQLLEKHPVAFVGETELGTAGSVPIIDKAGVPLVGAAGITPELVTSHDAFAFGLDAVGDWAGWTKYLATDGGAKKINLLNLDIPAGPVFEAVVRSVAKANGATVDKVVSLPLTATDVTAQMAAVSQGNPDVIMAVTTAQLCVPVSQAHASLAPSTKLFLPGICGSPQTLQAGGSSIDGALLGYGSLNPYDTTKPDVATFRRAMDTYGAAKVPLSQFSSNAVTAVINLKHIIDGLDPTAVTAAAITAAIRAGVDVPSFMTDTYTCDARLAFSPVTCSRGRRVFQVQGGELKNLSDKWYDGTADVKLG